jgi:hypothetical protein
MDLKTLTASTLTDMFNETFGKAVKVGTYPKSKMIADLEAHAAKFDPARPEEPEVDPMRPEEAWPTTEVISEPVNPLTFEEVPGGVDYPAPAPTTEEEKTDESAESRLARGACPFCGGDPANQTAAGEEGTFLGDSCNYCHDCDKTYNSITGVEVPTRDMKKRRILNPQAKIDAKEAALLEAGFGLTYDRNARLWTVGSNREGELVLWNMTSKQFAEFSPKEIVAQAEARIRPQA